MRQKLHRWKAAMASLLALTMLLGMLPVAALAAEGNNFTDTTGHWGKESIDRVVAEGLFTGISDTTFNPDGSMTRSMFVTVLQRMADKLKGPAPTGEAVTFSDVPSGTWYTAGVEWAVRTGVTTGYGNGKFGPDDLVTREQMCVFMIRFLGDYMGYDLTSFKPGAKFDDDAAISSWAKDAVYLAQAMGLVQGVGGNTFEPQSSATRASVAVIADRLLVKVETLTLIALPTPTPPAGGGGGGGGGGGTTQTALTGVYIIRDGVNVSGKPVKSGDVLYAQVTPNATYTLSWTVGGVVKSTDKTYSVSVYDIGETVSLSVTGTGDYTGTVTDATGSVAVVVDLGNQDANKSPVVVAPGTIFMNDKGETVTIPADAVVTLSINKSDVVVPDAAKAELESEILKELGLGAPDAPEVVTVTVDVNLIMNALSTGGNDTAIHPVGTTTVTLSHTALGLPADADLSLYTVMANHTNKNGTPETIVGTPVTVEGASYIRFVLNGLSPIYIGSVAPVTVTFDPANGEAKTTKEVKAGTVLDVPTEPKKDGYTFTGWTVNGVAFDFTTKITKNTEIVATWKADEAQPETFKVTFLNGDGSDFDVQDVKKGDKVAMPEGKPVKAANYFIGWDFNFNTAINEATTIIAKWLAITPVKSDNISVVYGINNTVGVYTLDDGKLSITKSADSTDVYTLRVTPATSGAFYTLGNTADASYTSNEVYKLSDGVSYAEIQLDGDESIYITWWDSSDPSTKKAIAIDSVEVKFVTEEAAPGNPARVMKTTPRR